MQDERLRPDPTQTVQPSRVSRRSALKGLAALMAVGAVAPLAAACGQQAPAPAAPAKSATESKPATASGAAPKVETKPAADAKPAAGAPKTGGTLKVAIIGEPPHLDPQFGTQTVTADTMWHVYETLFARDSKQVPQPHLLESYEKAADGLSATMQLRKGVLFHDDQEMTSADVVASMQRYGSLAARGKSIMDRVESLSAPDKYTVSWKFKQPTAGILPIFLSQRDSLVTTEKLATAFPKDKITAPIGTGPYKFLEHVSDRHLRLGRFDKYVPNEAPADGSAGRRIAYIDEITFIPVPEESVRADGVGTGEYHYGESLAPDSYDKVKSLPNVEADVARPYFWAVVHFNKKEGLFTNQKLRQAVLAAVKIDPIAAAAFGNKEFYRIDPAIAAPETAWHTDVGKEVYNNPDPEKAKALIKEAGYDGTPIRWMSTKEYFYNYNGSLPFKQQLEAVGLNVDLQIMDWATLGRRRSDPKEYDVFVTGHSAYVHPVMQPYLASAWPGWWESAEKDRLVGAIMAETDEAKAMDLIRQLQQLQYTEVPGIKYGEYFTLRARSNKVKGTNNPTEWFFWNAWIE